MESPYETALPRKKLKQRDISKESYYQPIMQFIPKKEKYEIDDADRCVKGLIGEFEMRSN